MCTNISTDTEFQPVTEGAPPPKKKKIGCKLRHPQEKIQEIKSCLQSLCEESICQEIQTTEDLHLLIKQQQQQQQQLKFSILKLLSRPKKPNNKCYNFKLDSWNKILTQDMSGKQKNKFAAAFHRPPRTFKTDPPFLSLVTTNTYCKLHLNLNSRPTTFT